MISEEYRFNKIKIKLNLKNKSLKKINQLKNNILKVKNVKF